MRDLQQIEKEFLTVVETTEPQRTRSFISLMNELERDYSTFTVSPTATDLERDDVQLYRKISLSRDL